MRGLHKCRRLSERGCWWAAAGHPIVTVVVVVLKKVGEDGMLEDVVRQAAGR